MALPRSRNPPLRLHIGGEIVREGWKILNVQAGPGVDFVGHCQDLSQFQDSSVAEIYASHVYEHLNYVGEIQQAMKEAYRVLVPGGLFRLGVPDLDTLCRLFLDPKLSEEDRFFVQRMIYGGQTGDHDYHKVGLNLQFLTGFLKAAGFKNIRRLPDFGALFDDTTLQKFQGVPISLNVMAMK